MSLYTKWILRGASLIIATLLTSCTTTKTTTTVRSATEQLLLSSAADRALQNAGLEIFAGQKVFLDTNFFDSYDAKYAEGTIRDALSRAGARLESNLTNADIVIEARSGALAMDGSESMFGLPSMTVPVPLAGALQTPEISFYKSQIQSSTAKFALLAYQRQSAAHIYSSGALDGKSFDKHSSLLCFSWHRTDLLEKQLTEKDRQQYEIWHRQYDLENLPATNAVDHVKK